ncbi:MAG: hypothetical protein HRS57_02460 [Mycoplasmataceae bacterium]|nr:hypothetical protein [Mycoplasmataceae bacterium]
MGDIKDKDIDSFLDNIKLDDLVLGNVNEDELLEYLLYIKLNNGQCFECEEKKFYKIKNSKKYECVNLHIVSPTSGTIFHKSSTPLSYWFYAICKYKETDHKYTATDLQKDIGVTYKTAWRMISKIKELDNVDISKSKKYVVE